MWCAYVVQGWLPFRCKHQHNLWGTWTCHAPKPFPLLQISSVFVCISVYIGPWKTIPLWTKYHIGAMGCKMSEARFWWDLFVQQAPNLQSAKCLYIWRHRGIVFSPSQFFAAIGSRGDVLQGSFQALALFLTPIFVCEGKVHYESGRMCEEATGVCGVWEEFCEEVTEGWRLAIEILMGKKSCLQMPSLPRVSGKLSFWRWGRRQVSCLGRGWWWRRRLPHSNGLTLRFLNRHGGTLSCEGVRGRPVLWLCSYRGMLLRQSDRPPARVNGKTSLVATANWAPP